MIEYATSRAEREAFLDAVLGDQAHGEHAADAYAVLAHGYNGSIVDGRYVFSPSAPVDSFYAWPAERDKLLDDLDQVDALALLGERVDSYLVPVLRWGTAPNKRGHHVRHRRKANGTDPATVWADLDGEVTDHALLEKLDAVQVESGSPGHLHVYVRLDRPITVGQAEALSKALAPALAGEAGDSKHSNNSLLRVPGGRNGKHGTPVRLVRVAGKLWDPTELAALLGVDLDDAVRATPAAGVEPVDGVAPPAELPKMVRTALTAPLPPSPGGKPDRSAGHQRLVESCAEAGLSLGETVSVAASYPPSVEKFDGRLAAEVARSFAKALERIDQRAAAARAWIDARPGGAHCAMLGKQVLAVLDHGQSTVAIREMMTERVIRLIWLARQHGCPGLADALMLVRNVAEWEVDTELADLLVHRALGSREVAAEIRKPVPERQCEHHRDQDDAEKRWTRDDVPATEEPTPEPGEPSAPASAPAPSPGLLPNWSPHLYEQHPLLRAIRDHAWSRLQSADAVALAALAYISDQIPGGCVIDSGIGRPVPAGLFVALVAASGGGKSAGNGVAQHLTDAPPPLALSTGEGLLEAFYGEVPEEDEKGRERMVRRRVRSNAMAFTGEAESIFAEQKRDASKLGPILRSAWSGEHVGTANADKARQRSLDAGTYSVSLIVGLQPSIAHHLIGDTGTGTAQRFLWASGTDPFVDPDAPSWAGPLFEAPRVPVMVDGRPVRDSDRFTVAPAVRGELRAQRLRVLRGEEQPDEMDSQRPVQLLKLAAVFAWADGTLAIGVEHWTTAKALLAESDRVRDALIEHAEQMDRDAQREEGLRRGRVRRSEMGFDKDLLKTMVRVAGALDRHGPITLGRLKARVTKALHGLVGDALAQLMAGTEPRVVKDGNSYDLSPAGRAWLAEQEM